MNEWMVDLSLNKILLCQKSVCAKLLDSLLGFVWPEKKMNINLCEWLVIFLFQLYKNKNSKSVRGEGEIYLPVVLLSNSALKIHQHLCLNSQIIVLEFLTPSDHHHVLDFAVIMLAAVLSVRTDGLTTLSFGTDYKVCFDIFD